MHSVRFGLLLVAFVFYFCCSPTVGTNIPYVCQNLTLTFNAINGLLGVIANFEGGKVPGYAYPSGNITLDSNARKLSDCRAYKVDINESDNTTDSNLIVHMEFTDNIILQFGEASEYNQLFKENRAIRINIQDCIFVIHYQINVLSNQSLLLTPIMGEIKSLGVVELIDQNEPTFRKYITNEAEDVIRPKLLGGFNWFIQQHLTWTVDPNETNNLDGIEAFRYIMKGAMLNIGKKSLFP